MTKQKFLVQGVILTVISLIMKSSNMFYRSYLSSKIGAEGLGLYQLIFSIFILAITLSTSGISLAVTRLVSSCIAQNKRSEIRSVVKKCLFFCFSLSFTISLIFFFFSDFCATVFLGNSNAANSLKILGVGLVFMSSCTCMRGYFLAVDESVSCALAELCEQAITIGLTVIIFVVMPFNTIEEACFYAMVSSTIGESVSFIIDIISCKYSLNKHTPLKTDKAKGVFKAMTRIALPCTFSSAARSLLSTTENLLIPRQLRLSGYSYSQSMVQYGLLQGMAIPVLYFPSAFIGSFASLLIPKICKEYELNHKNAVAHISAKALNTTIAFGVITSAVFLGFPNLISTVFYQNEDAGYLIKILAPLVPLMYLDIVVDCILKGLDKQLSSMKLNIVDSLLRVVFILIFMEGFGINAYIVILFFSVIFNASISIHKLIKVTKLKLNFFRNLSLQIPCALICVYISANLFCPFSSELLMLIYYISLSYIFYYVVYTMSIKLFGMRI